MKKTLSVAVLLFSAVTAQVASAQLNTTPVAEDVRQKFVCVMDRHDGMPDYEFNAIVDWDGPKAHGAGLIVAVQYNYDDGIHNVETKRRLVERFEFDMISDETPYEQYFKFSPNTDDKALLITWRQDFGDDVPVQHYLKYKGVKYKFKYCYSLDARNRHVTPGYSANLDEYISNLY